MNFKTTLVLLLLVVAGGVFFWLDRSHSSLLPFLSSHTEDTSNATLRFLEDDLTPKKLGKIHIRFGDKEVVLERGTGADWTMPGKWPTRKPEVEELVNLLTG